MKYKYTWSHIKLLAQICGYPDTSSNVGENWIKILENHQETTFPFTLWPLTYRTSALMASPAVFSPILSNFKTHSCEMTVKFYRSNEVIVICFIHAALQELCNKMCLFETMCENVQHKDHSSNEKLDASLVKCGLLTLYKQLKSKIIKQLNKVRAQNTDDEISCIICVGYGEGAAMANFMSMDLSMEFRELQDFMDEETSIVVDCVTFSSPSLGNNKFWIDFENLVDGHVDVQHVTSPNTREKSIVIGDTEETVLMGRAVDINMYLSEIDKKINI